MNKQCQALGLGAVLCVWSSAVLAGNCAARDTVVDRLQSKYDETLAMGGLQGTQNTQSVMEIWASRDTGTFTVLLTSPSGVSCIVAAGTDFFEATPTSPEKPGTEG